MKRKNVFNPQNWLGYSSIIALLAAIGSIGDTAVMIVAILFIFFIIFVGYWAMKFEIDEAYLAGFTDGTKYPPKE